MLKISWTGAALILAHIWPSVYALDPLEHINLFIGTINGGHTFPGATVPHGLVKVGMDTDSPGNHAGYDGDPSWNVTGFSELHQSGTGGQVPLSNFKIFPIHNCSVFEQCLTTIEERKISRSVLADGSPDDFASPGYFATNLSNSIRVELTATRRTALHRYTFPIDSTTPRILLDVTNDGQLSASDITMLIDPDTGRMTGSGSFANSFGKDRYHAYACVDFDQKPFEYGPYKINYADLWGTDIHQHYYTWGYEHGGLVGFQSSGVDVTTILVRVGISLISVDQACSNAEEEIPNFDFESVVRDSEDQWRDILSRVQVEAEGVDEDTVTLLYSSLYRTHVAPADFSGENPGWVSDEPYWDALYCNWDTYRTLFPLLSLHDPVNFASVVRGMIDIQRHEGWLPEGREMGTQLYIQGGSHGDPILADFFVKYQHYAEKLGVSADNLYAALLADAEDTPPNWNVQGRQADAWKEYGYIPSDTTFRGGANTKQVSRSIEYAFNDFTISQVSKALGHSEDAVKYAARAQNYLNSWNGNVSMPERSNVTGFFQPKFMNGTWNYTDPRHCSVNDPTKSTCFLNAIRRDGFYETSPIVYSQYVPHDTAKLIELQGGVDSFVERLDFMFENNYFDSTNEPSQQIPYMYHYADKPGRTAERVRETISFWFNTSRNGLPGNDDSGAMGSYVFFYLAGLYPLPGTKQFLLSSPYFPSISFFNPLFNTTTSIVSHNFGGGNIYVEGVKVNGEAYKSNCFLEWEVFMKGSTVELELSSNREVGCGQDGLPPSLSTGGYD
ncbi:glycoside hydrolase family 92 protein [Cylindrobasidium torrendii FP15055 ss-10]|uniref:Glycoside hydrolase family 92 protein n=1 Tax=Cylindrobasidium torrendii FP15055 ss-10 TaxID=1314674 RepID=A0A0D7B9J8_9AGAR|nr:glycoside hydrolase family 92 protein [Cylindrobasidium torrendii FP15055 ss-10]